MAEDIRRLVGLPDSVKPVGQPKQNLPNDQEAFGKVLNNLVNEVDSLHKTAEQATDKMMTGELEDVHQVVIAMEEAETSFKLLMEIRNKMVDAYREVMKMQV